MSGRTGSERDGWGRKMRLGSRVAFHRIQVYSIAWKSFQPASTYKCGLAAQ